MIKKLRCGLDIDQCIADFWNPYLEKFGQPKNDSEITKNCKRKLEKDRNFWLSLPVIRKPIGFDPTLYCTKRSCLKTYTKEWLDNNEFSHKPVYQVLYQKANKANYIKGRIDVFVDDSIFNVIQMNESGVPCLLMDTPYNQEFGPLLRIYSLDYYEIEEVYYLAKELGVFDNFKIWK